MNIGPEWLPIVGTLPLIKKLCIKYGSQHIALDTLRHEYGSDIISLKFGSEKVVVVFSQDLIKEMFTQRPLQGRPDNFFIRMRTNGKRAGVTMVDGPLWVEHRGFLIKHLRQLGLGKNLMEGMILDEFLAFENHLDSMVHREIQLSTKVAGSVLNVLWVMVAGHKFDLTSEKLSNILSLMRQRGQAFQITGGLLGFFPWLRFLAPDKCGYTLLKSLSDQLYSLINETIITHKERLTNISPDDETPAEDFMDAFLLEMKRGNVSYTEDQLLAICLDMFIAGSETTSNTLDFAFLNMVRHPDVQAKVQKEIDAVLGPHEKPSYALKTKLPLVEAVLLECQRMFNVVPLTGPHRATEDTQLGGYNIPQETRVMACLYSIHYNPDTWSDPDTFRPDRFLNEDGSFKNCDSLYQFGFGKRRCLGETLARSFIFIYFVGVLHRYEIRTDDENIFSEPLPGITIRPKPYNVILKPRHCNT
uniref:Probable cytochrome P450 305a1 n=1 Tax=Cacopsylla melanoneura TaxID=428564 RepID=A0A8D8Q798_9HEMI